MFAELKGLPPMSDDAGPNPIDDARRIGTVVSTTAQGVMVNLPNAGRATSALHHGDPVRAGEVGEYVCFARRGAVVLGRITKVELPERDRLAVEPRVGNPLPVDPVGLVALLTDISLVGGEVTGAIDSPPRIGAAAYSVSAAFLRWALEASVRSRGEAKEVVLELGRIAGAATEAPILVSPERLFGRHCAVLGVTGGGKSWTIARLVEECSRFNSKVILIDATGEFHTLNQSVRHASIGSEADGPTGSTPVALPHHSLSSRDLFALFKPSGQSQAPLLREAIRSLKLAKCPNLPQNLVDEEGCIPKKRRVKAELLSVSKLHIERIEADGAEFDINLLHRQIQHECVQDFGEKNWGDIDFKTIGYCTSLMMRIASMVKDSTFAPIFRQDGHLSVQTLIDKFNVDTNSSILRLSLRFLSFAQSVRPIVVNAMGHHLLDLARKGTFRKRPTVVILDEAHQFLGKSVGDEVNTYSLDAFDLIAKEGRKYGLTLCLATQRPRDIQDGVLSQIGTMIVHRLTHGADREVVERAARDVEKSVAGLLPTLSPGQALLLGADFPVPIPIQILEPTRKPESRGPNYQDHWSTIARTHPTT